MEEDTVGMTLAHVHASDEKWGGKDPGETFEKLQSRSMVFLGILLNPV